MRHPGDRPGGRRTAVPDDPPCRRRCVDRLPLAAGNARQRRHVRARAAVNGVVGRAGSGADSRAMTVVDAHHHVWDPSRRDYPWMTGLPALQRRFDTSDLAAVATPCGVARTILVQT